MSTKSKNARKWAFFRNNSGNKKQSWFYLWNIISMICFIISNFIPISRVPYDKSKYFLNSTPYITTGCNQYGWRKRCKPHDSCTGRFPGSSRFYYPTTAYQKFIETNRLEPTIQTTLNGIDVFDPVNLEKASQTIRTAFASGKMPEEIRSRICESYIAFWTNLQWRYVSSATCEDLPELSFAGQQDTYLNVISEEVLIRKVIECWSSLWTARSIGYRVHQNVPQDGIMIAVVIQKMVESEASECYSQPTR